MTHQPPEAAAPSPARRAACWVPAGLLLALYVLLLVGGASLPRDRGPETARPQAESIPARLTVALITVETIVLAVGAPFLAACSLKRLGGSMPMLGAVACVAILVGAGIAACGIAAPGGTPVGTLLWSQVYLVSFAALLAAVVGCLARAGCGPALAQLAATALALAMVGSVFYANAAIEAAASSDARGAVISAVLWGNPWLIVTGSILETDPLRSEQLYSFSVMHLYGLRYPGTGIDSMALRAVVLSAWYGGAAAAAWAAGRLLGRLRRR